jgi:hypothetical protein
MTIHALMHFYFHAANAYLTRKESTSRLQTIIDAHTQNPNQHTHTHTHTHTHIHTYTHPALPNNLYYRSDSTQRELKAAYASSLRPHTQ